MRPIANVDETEMDGDMNDDTARTERRRRYPFCFCLLYHTLH